MKLRIVILGLSITSSWGNGHATVYRGLTRELLRRGHDVLFLERDKPWYAGNRDKEGHALGNVSLYSSIDELKKCFASEIESADCVIVGSFTPDGAVIGEWVTTIAAGLTVFYDIDTPVTQSLLAMGTCEYLSPNLIPRYGLYLSFTGGPILKKIEQAHGARQVRPFYCCVDVDRYYPDLVEKTFDLGYMGTYSPDRQQGVESLLLSPARECPAGSFVVAGAMYPESVQWPNNVQKIDHIPPSEHRTFYNSQRFTLNLTRSDMLEWGYSPSVRLFEAAACGVPIITDDWPGLNEFFVPGEEILTAHSAKEMLDYLYGMSDREARAIAERARCRILAEHTAAHRAAELESMILGCAPQAGGRN